jgi:hypothetical protein
MLYPHQCNTVAAIADSPRQMAELELMYPTYLDSNHLPVIEDVTFVLAVQC